MPYKDSDKQRSYQRLYQRHRRAAQVKGNSRTLHFGPEATPTAEGVLAILGTLLHELVAASGLDIMIRARTIAYIAGVTLKAIETASLEPRVAALEAKAQDGG